jgi:hypothetical protein
MYIVVSVLHQLTATIPPLNAAAVAANPLAAVENMVYVYEWGLVPYRRVCLCNFVGYKRMTTWKRKRPRMKNEANGAVFFHAENIQTLIIRSKVRKVYISVDRNNYIISSVR